MAIDRSEDRDTPWGSAANTRPARGIRPRVPVTRFWLPAPVQESRSQELWNDLSLSKPTSRPARGGIAANACKVEAQLAHDRLDAAEQERLCRRAELIRSLLTIT